MLRGLVAANGRRLAPAASTPTAARTVLSAVAPSLSSASIAAPARSFAAGGKGGKKNKKVKTVTYTQPESGRKFGQGAKDRPERFELRAAAEKERLAAWNKVHVSPTGDIVTDDESLQPLYDALNKGDLDKLHLDPAKLAANVPTFDASAEELWMRKAEMDSKQYVAALKMSDELKNDLRVVDDDFDHLAETEVELSDDMITDGDDPRAIAGWTVPKATARSRDEDLERGLQYLRRMAGGKQGSGRQESASSTAAAAAAAGGGAPLDSSGSSHDSDSAWDAVMDDDSDAADDLEFNLSDAESGSRGGRADSRRGGRVPLPSRAEVAAAGGVYDDEEPGFMEAPPLAKMRRAAFLASLGAEAENDAMLEEQARALLAGRQPSAIASLLEDSSEAEVDERDPRYMVDPLTQYRDYKARFNYGDTDTEVEQLLQYGVDDSSNMRIGPAFGSGVHKIPQTILDELATPYDLQEHHEGKPYPDAATVREAAMTPEERVLDEQRKKLSELIERPLPVVNRPIWPLHALLAAVDQVQQVVKGGMIASTRCCIVVGNGMGGGGFGIGKHKEPFMATKQALANAQRDMVHVSLHKKQLYHDLIGKKNNLYVIVRTMPASTVAQNCSPLIQDIFEMMGIEHASAKIVGSRRRNPYNVVQALFDSFNHHMPPEHEAYMRGLRMQWMGADRHNPRNVYPFSPSGPRYPSANARYATGRLRA